MARVYLVSPPYGHVYKKINLKGFGVLQPPLGLAYLASFLKSRGHAVKLFDGMFAEDLFKDIEVCPPPPPRSRISSREPNI